MDHPDWPVQVAEQSNVNVDHGDKEQLNGAVVEVARESAKGQGQEEGNLDDLANHKGHSLGRVQFAKQTQVVADANHVPRCIHTHQHQRECNRPSQSFVGVEIGDFEVEVLGVGGVTLDVHKNGAVEVHHVEHEQHEKSD